MQQEYLALLRGINVGGNSLIKMADLGAALAKDGFTDVRTYIQSGNVIFKSKINNADEIARNVESSIEKHFGIQVAVAIFTKREWQQIIANAPQWWGKNDEWKHNLIVLLKPYDMQETIEAVGLLKSEIEAMEPGEGVLYQSMSRALFGRTTTGKISSSPIYKRMTIRNYNTATKLLKMFSQ